MRAFFVCIHAARINDESVKPSRILQSVSSYSFNTEVQRFFDEIMKGEAIALSGMKLFFLTRKLILSVSNSLFNFSNLFI